MLQGNFSKNIGVSFTAYFLSTVLSFISIPILINHFGSNLYAIWALIISLITYLNNISFGLPAAVTVLVAKVKNPLLRKGIILRSFMILLFISLCMILLTFILDFIDSEWTLAILGNINPIYTSEAKSSFRLVILLILIKIPVSIFLSYFAGLGKIYITQLYNIVIYISDFLLIILVLTFDLSFTHLAFLTILSQIFISLIAMLHCSYKFKLFLNISKVKRPSYKFLYFNGISFFQVVLAANIVWGTDALVISHYLSSDYIAPYSLAFKIFSLCFISFSLIGYVFGPIYGRLCALNDWKKIQTIINANLSALPRLAGFLWIGLIIYSDNFINIWTGDANLFGGYDLMFILGLYLLLLSFINPLSCLAYSLNYAKNLTVYIWMEAGLNLVLSIIFVNMYGIAGVALGTAMAALIIPFSNLPRLMNILCTKRLKISFFPQLKFIIFILAPSLLFATYIETGIVNEALKLLLFIVTAILYISLSFFSIGMDEKNFIVNFRKQNL